MKCLAGINDIIGENMKNIPYYKAVRYDNFYEMLYALYRKQPQKTAVKYRRQNTLYGITYKTLTEHIAGLYRYFKQNGIENVNIGILSENRYEYIPIYLSAVFCNVIAPIDRELTADMLAGLIDKFDIKVLLYTNKTKDKALAAASKIICVNIDGEFDRIVQTPCDTARFFDSIKGTDSDRFSVLAFTSGTTGNIKGVMLSQHNIVSNLRAAIQNNHLKTPTLQILPMNHTYGFNPGVLTPLYNGNTVCINMSLKELAKDFKFYNPYYIGVVPMMAEGIYNNIIREARRRGKEKLLRRLIKISGALRRVKIDLRRLFFGGLINRRLRLISCGGAALNPFYAERFEELGIKLLNGYGLTECSPLVSVNRAADNVPESVGRVVYGTEVKTAPDGEILVRGNGVMLGYYKEPQATVEAMEDGWYKTGDIGYIENGLLYITGRKKNLIILENGKNFSPEFIENELMKLPYVKECLVFPRRNKNHSLIIAKILPEGNCDGIDGDIERINRALPDYMRIDGYELTDVGFEKTSTKKIIRSGYV